jgi:thiol-disulfide isomerase/thioredoxin
MKEDAIETVRPALCLAVLAIATVMAGCDKPKPETNISNTTVNSTRPTEVARATEEQAALLKDFAPVSEADKAWQDVVSSMREPSYPPEWETNAPSREEVAAFEKKTGQLAASVADKARDFYTRFPDHANASEAREQEYQLLSLAAQLGDTNSAMRVSELEQAQLKDPKLSEDERFEIRLQQLQRRVMSTGDDDKDGAAVAQLEAGARQLQKEFAARPEVQTLLLSAAQGWLEQGNVEKSRALLGELTASGSEEVKEAAGELTKKLERVGKPLELKFTAFDGRSVDLQSLKGKVVLIDFWATWCRPCMAELPQVKNTYERLHDRGFEIIGISLDKDKTALERVLEREKMTWPQAFGETSNQLAEEHGISGIPAMWLVDAKGALRDLNARSDLAGKVQKLLGEAAQ